VLGDIGKLVPFFNLVIIFLWCIHDLRLENACSSASHRVFKMCFACFSLVKSFVSNFSSLEFSFPYFGGFLACH